MKKIFFLSCFLFIAMVAFSQTKRVAHRSHSGKNNTFSVIGSTDNFGLPVPDSVKTKTKNKNKNKTKPVKDSVPVMPVKDTIKTLPATSKYNEQPDTFRYELAIALLTAKKLFDL
jgi:hypothetical protein